MSSRTCVLAVVIFSSLVATGARSQQAANVRLQVPVKVQGLAPGIYDALTVTCTATSIQNPGGTSTSAATQPFTDTFDGTVSLMLALASSQPGEAWGYSCQLSLRVKATGAVVLVAYPFAVNSQQQGFIRGSFTI